MTFGSSSSVLGTEFVPNTPMPIKGSGGGGGGGERRGGGGGGGGGGRGRGRGRGRERPHVLTSELLEDTVNSGIVVSTAKVALREPHQALCGKKGLLTLYRPWETA